MHRLWRGLVRTLLWTYERGSWPYDIMVLVIVLFVLVTPRRWFHDAPLAVGAYAHCVQPEADNAGRQTTAYRLDAACLRASDRAGGSSPELEKDVHDLLGRSVPGLAGRTFQVQSIYPYVDGSREVKSYEVTVRMVSIP